MAKANISAEIAVVQHRDGRVIVAGQFKNLSQDGETYRILTWNTPINGEAYFGPVVTVERESGSEDGSLFLLDDYFKRGLHGWEINEHRVKTPNDYIDIKAGEETDLWHFFLTDIVEIDKDADYLVTLNCSLLEVFVITDAGEELAENLPLNVTSKPFPVALKAYREDTLANEYSKLGTEDVTLSAKGSLALAPEFATGSTDAADQQVITAAHNAAYLWVKSAENIFFDENVICENKNINRWFNTHYSPRGVQAIANCFANIARHMETVPITYDFTHPDAKNRESYAYVTGTGDKWDGVIYLAKSFWKPETKLLGMDSKAGTIIHELAHGVDRATDFASQWYGQEPTMKLAQFSSWASIMHAEALEYFCETTLPFSGYFANADNQVVHITTGNVPPYTADVVLWADGKLIENATATMDFSGEHGRFRLTCKGAKSFGVGLLNTDLNQITWTGSNLSPGFKAAANMIYIPAGRDTIGSPLNETSRDAEEMEQQSVLRNNGYFISALLVTKNQFKNVDQKTDGPRKLVKDGYPAQNMSWIQAQDYCRKRTQNERASGEISANWEYRLPTELEWETAARAGTTTAFWWGNDDPPSYHELARNEIVKPTTAVQTVSPVGWRAKNPWGMYDMLGNLREWCDGPGSVKPVRGGGCGDFGAECRSSKRRLVDGSSASYYIGFRVVLAPCG